MMVVYELDGLKRLPRRLRSLAVALVVLHILASVSWANSRRDRTG